MIIKKNLHLKNLKRFRVSEGRDLEKGLRLDRNEKVDNWPKDFINKVNTYHKELYDLRKRHKYRF